MSFNKNISHLLCTFAATLAIIVSLNILAGISGTALLSAIIDKVIFMSLLLIVDNFFRKLFKERQDLCKEYYLGMLLEIISVISLALMRYSTSLLQFALGAVGLLFFLVSLIIYDKYVYDMIDLLPTEFANKRFAQNWIKLKKSFRNKTKDDIFASLSSFLRFKVEGDTIEGALLFDCPFDCNDLSTLHELRVKEENDINKIIEVENYINKLIKSMEAN